MATRNMAPKQNRRIRQHHAAETAKCLLQLRMSRQREANFKGRMRTYIHAFPAQHAITCDDTARLARKDIVKDFGIAQTRRLACATMHAQIMVDLHARQTHATERFIHAAKRAQRAAPHAVRPE